jgi:hypothetical protein
MQTPKYWKAREKRDFLFMSEEEWQLRKNLKIFITLGVIICVISILLFI